MHKNNVIELRTKKSTTTTSKASAATAPILDMTERRNEMILQERRKVKRTILSEFVGACIVVPQRGLLKVSLYDISDTGIAFDLDSKFGQVNDGEEVAVRVYLNSQTYFPFIVKVKHGKFLDTESSYRYGASFVSETINNEALKHFVKFIETVSASLQTDQGDIMVSNLGR